MASTARPATKGVSTKSIVKYLSKYCAISVEDLTNPNVSTHANGGGDYDLSFLGLAFLKPL